jgi:hypothetical protein
VSAVSPIDTLRAVPTDLRRLILWDYQRGVWQYDVICAIIVAFIFLSPPRWFRDQPRVPNVAEITSPTAHPGESAFYVGPELVDAFPDEQRLVEIGKILTAQRRRKITVTRIDPIYNSDQEVIGYMAYAKP